jgi:hypothetical protein
MEGKKPRSTEEIHEEKAKEFKKFTDKLVEAETVEAAWNVVDSAPSQDHPGHKYYARLEFLLKSHLVPLSADKEEKLLYAGLMNRIRGELEDGVVEKIIAGLQESLK